MKNIHIYKIKYKLKLIIIKTKINNEQQLYLRKTFNGQPCTSTTRET